ncbi:MAG: cell division protein FtsB [Porticoccus sp.]|nr:cell division protein FtsB [Porticoccus sp.]MBQ0807378.1 cell division protein FtsB [Porticoccus sp.]
MRWLLVILTLFFLLLQYRLWVGEGSMAQRQVLQHKVDIQQEENDVLHERNSILAGEVSDLKDGLESVEERARTDLGMVKEGETFYMVVDKEQK